MLDTNGKLTGILVFALGVAAGRNWPKIQKVLKTTRQKSVKAVKSLSAKIKPKAKPAPAKAK